VFCTKDSAARSKEGGGGNLRKGHLIFKEVEKKKELHRKRKSQLRGEESQKSGKRRGNGTRVWLKASKIRDP